ncbi:hypothetical protein [Afipia sp. DC4300-2b1]|uniref:hypothetical protein n=1 Tax=Afipia sp. DC4300-2b1 TaxID=2804672 RepID=UPI003CED2514
MKISFFRRTKSRYADDKAVDDFARVDETGILRAQQRIDEAAAIIGKDSAPTSEDVDRLGKLLGGP